MRDILVLSIVFAGSVAALRWPWIGIMLWTWLSIMNPHRYTYGVAYSAPVAAIAAACVMMGLILTNERKSPLKGAPVWWLLIFMGWVTVSWLAGLSPSDDYEQWKKVMKVDVMILVALMLLSSKRHIIILMWVCVGSLALLGIKGGVFTLTSGGEFHVWGPPGSFIEDNNEFALALVMVIPLLRFLQLQVQNGLARWAFTGTMLLCAISALGSQSRGALLGISAMLLTLWWRAHNKLRMGVLLVLTAIPMLGFMPQEWLDRMSTIHNYEEDRSAMGRISAWWTAWGIGLHFPFGVGFNAAVPELFARYSPYPDMVLAAHSIYFQVMGNHGLIGLALYLGIWLSTWRVAGGLRSQTNISPEMQWTADLGALCQVSLVGYAVGGAFLSLAYFDLPYDIMVMVVLTRIWVEKSALQTTVVSGARWRKTAFLDAWRKPV